MCIMFTTTLAQADCFFYNFCFALDISKHQPDNWDRVPISFSSIYWQNISLYKSNLLQANAITVMVGFGEQRHRSSDNNQENQENNTSNISISILSSPPSPNYYLFPVFPGEEDMLSGASGLSEGEYQYIKLDRGKAAVANVEPVYRKVPVLTCCSNVQTLFSHSLFQNIRNCDFGHPTLTSCVHDFLDRNYARCSFENLKEQRAKNGIKDEEFGSCGPEAFFKGCLEMNNLKTESMIRMVKRTECL